MQHFKYGKEIVQTTTTLDEDSDGALLELACVKASVVGKIPWPEGAVRVRVSPGLQKSFGYFKKLPNFALVKMLFENIDLVME